MKEENEMMQVPKEQLEKLLSEIDPLKKKTSILEEIADKNELARYHERTKDRSVRTCRIRVLREEDGAKKVVTGWGSMVTNDVFIGPMGRSVATQVVKIFLEDGTEKVIDLLTWGRSYEMMNATILESSKVINEQGEETQKLKLKAENGKEYVMSSVFIN